MTSRRMERIAGIASGALGALGVVGLAVALFGPIYQYAAYKTISGVVPIPLPPDLLIPMTLSLVLPLLVLVGALLHSRQSGSLVGLVLLLGATGALLIAIIFNPIQMLQLFLLPSLLLALVACALAFRNGRQSSSVSVNLTRG